MAIHIDNGFPAFGMFVPFAAHTAAGLKGGVVDLAKRRIPAASDVNPSQTITF